MRGRRTVKISIYDIVVGDVIPLRIGDRVSIFCQYKHLWSQSYTTLWPYVLYPSGSLRMEC